MYYLNNINNPLVKERKIVILILTKLNFAKLGVTKIIFIFIQKNDTFI